MAEKSARKMSERPTDRTIKKIVYELSSSVISGRLSVTPKREVFGGSPHILLQLGAVEISRLSRIADEAPKAVPDLA